MASVDTETVCFKCEDADPSFKVECSNDSHGLKCHATYHEKCLQLIPTTAVGRLSSEHSLVCSWYCNNCGYYNNLTVSFAFYMNYLLIQSFEKCSSDFNTELSKLGDKMTQSIKQLGSDLNLELETVREKLSQDVEQLGIDVCYELKALSEGVDPV